MKHYLIIPMQFQNDTYPAFAEVNVEFFRNLQKRMAETKPGQKVCTEDYSLDVYQSYPHNMPAAELAEAEDAIENEEPILVSCPEELDSDDRFSAIYGYLEIGVRDTSVVWSFSDKHTGAQAESQILDQNVIADYLAELEKPATG